MNLYYAYGSKLRSGMRVEIIRHHKYRRYNLVGMTGTVYSVYGNEVRVEVDGVRNDNACSGHFYFTPKELQIIDDEKINECVKENETMPNITNYFNAVKIQFIGDTMPCKYIYANFESDLKEGDLCVVMPAHHGLALARVTEVINDNGFETPREIVARVETGFYDERVKAREKAAELKAKMQERAKKLQGIALYQMLAKDDSEMMDLLNAYQSLPMY